MQYVPKFYKQENILTHTCHSGTVYNIKAIKLTVPKRHTPSPTFDTAPVVQSVFILMGLLTSIRPQSMKY